MPNNVAFDNVNNDPDEDVPLNILQQKWRN